MSYECRELAVHAILDKVTPYLLLLVIGYAVYAVVQTAFLIRMFLRE